MDRLFAYERRAPYDPGKGYPVLLEVDRGTAAGYDHNP